jgi:hypothetical protein
VISSYVGENAEFDAIRKENLLSLKELLLKNVALHKQEYLLSSHPLVTEQKWPREKKS